MPHLLLSKIQINNFKKLFGEKIIADGKTITDYNLIDILDGIERGDLKYYGKPTKEQLERQAMAIKACEVYGKDGYSSEKCKKEWEDLRDMDISETLRDANLSFVMIREDIWNHICNSYVGEFYNRDAQSVDDKDFYLSARRYCQIEFEKGIERTTKLTELVSKAKAAELTEENKAAVLAAHKELTELLTSGFAMGIFTRQDLNFLNPELYDKIAIEGDDKTRAEVLKYYTEFTIISSFIGETRRGWMIQAGAGSQHEGWKTHLMLAKKVLSLCNKKIKEYGDDYDE
jgi:hypothetical protein